MSYDVNLMINTGIEEHEVVDCGNYTYNVSPMYYKAFGEKGINAIDDMKASDVIPILKKVIIYFIEHEDELKLLNPENDWGNYEGALNYIQGILHECRRHPACTVRIG